MTDEAQQIEKLKQRVERFLGMTMHSKHDFETLSVEIYNHRKVLLSSTTLRRLWGYQEQGEHTASPVTLNTLARMIGYTSWEAFRDDKSAECNVSEMMTAGKSVQAKHLNVRTQVVVCWQPDRMVRMEYLGSDVFRVLENENSKLQVGDTMHCRQLTEGMPLYCEELLRPGCGLMNYVAGKEGGISFHILSADEDE